MALAIALALPQLEKKVEEIHRLELGREKKYLYQYIQWKKKNPKLEKLATIINIINVHFLS